MKYDVLQVIGAIVMCLFAQGAIRLLIDHDNHGLLGWIPVAFLPLLFGYAVLIAVGGLLTGWSHTRAKALGRRD
ncbi:hypothetical protein [Streptomyces sp. NPDC059819]|uniref:hypothetical protein n=1 Tax=Streptomyces sp. NPDC059819 TaxID=3346963 RepID=UPI0036667CC7